MANPDPQGAAALKTNFVANPHPSGWCRELLISPRADEVQAHLSGNKMAISIASEKYKVILKRDKPPCWFCLAEAKAAIARLALLDATK